MELTKKGEIFKYQINYLNTDCSPSHLFNNLSSTDKTLMFIHNSEVQPRIITIDHRLLTSENKFDKIATYISKFNSYETNEMLTIKCMLLNNVQYVGVGLYGGFKLWSNDGNRLLFQIPAKVKDKDRPYAFVAICEFVSQEGKPADTILCGDNYGTLYLVVGYGQIWRSKAIYNNDGNAITCLATIKENVCVGFENGEIHIFKIIGDTLIGSSLKIMNELKLPSLSMSIMNYSLEKNSIKEFLIVAFLNGEVKLFDIASGNLLSSVSCHLRMINSLATYNDYIITLGDDCFCNIFKVNSQEGDIIVVSNILIEDKMPVGLVILPKQENFDVVVANYDSTEIAHIKLTKEE